MNVNNIANGDRFGSSCEGRQVPAKDKPIDDRFCFEDEPTT